MRNIRKRRKPPQRPAPGLEVLTTIEILIYRSAVIISFVVYAFKHIRAEIFAP